MNFLEEKQIYNWVFFGRLEVKFMPAKVFENDQFDHRVNYYMASNVQ